MTQGELKIYRVIRFHQVNESSRFSMSLQEIERLSDDVVSLDGKFDSLEQDLDTHLLGRDSVDTEELIEDHETKRAMLDNVAQPVLQRGEHLIDTIRANEAPIPPSQNYPGSPAHGAASQERQQVQGILSHLNLRYSQLVDMWEKRRKELMQCKELREFEAGFQKVKFIVTDHALELIIMKALCDSFLVLPASTLPSRHI